VRQVVAAGRHPERDDRQSRRAHGGRRHHRLHRAGPVDPELQPAQQRAHGAGLRGGALLGRHQGVAQGGHAAQGAGAGAANRRSRWYQPGGAAPPPPAIHTSLLLPLARSASAARRP
jgi:hypothetical protein